MASQNNRFEEFILNKQSAFSQNITYMDMVQAKHELFCWKQKNLKTQQTSILGKSENLSQERSSYLYDQLLGAKAGGSEAWSQTRIYGEWEMWS